MQVDLDVGGRRVHVVGLHTCSKLYFAGPVMHMRNVAPQLPMRTGPAVVAGDFNFWGPAVVRLLPGLAARGAGSHLARAPAAQPDRPHPRERARRRPPGRGAAGVRLRPSTDPCPIACALARHSRNQAEFNVRYVARCRDESPSGDLSPVGARVDGYVQRLRFPGWMTNLTPWSAPSGVLDNANLNVLSLRRRAHFQPAGVFGIGRERRGDAPRCPRAR